MEESKHKKDKKILSNIFPDCVWIRLLDILLLYPKLLEKFMHASVHFRSFIYPRRTLFLLPEILPLLEKPWRKMSAHKYSKTDIIKLVLPKLRQTCTRWCNAVDNLSNPWGSLDSFGRLMVTYVSKYYNHNLNVEYVDEPGFLLHFERSHSINNGNLKSPFIGQAVFLHGKEQYMKQMSLQFEEELEIPFKQIVSTYGHLLKICRLYVFHQDVSLVLSHLLPYLPNVKTLGLDLYIMGALTQNGELNRLPKWSLLDNLPLFRQLRSLKVNTCQSPGAPLLKKLLAKAPNLRSLEIIAKQVSRTKTLIDCTQIEMAKLQDLTIGFLTTIEAPDNVLHRKLGHGLCSSDTRTRLVLSTLQMNCSALQNLRSLSLHFPCLSSDKFGEWKRYSLPFPNLTRLTLISNTWPCIDVSLLFKDTLENLVVDVRVIESLEKWKNAQVSEDIRNLEEIQFLSSNAILDKESNIWCKLPKLQMARLNVDMSRQYFGLYEWKKSSSWSRDQTLNED